MNLTFNVLSFGQLTMNNLILSLTLTSLKVLLSLRSKISNIANNNFNFIRLSLGQPRPVPTRWSKWTIKFGRVQSCERWSEQTKSPSSNRTGRPDNKFRKQSNWSVRVSEALWSLQNSSHLKVFTSKQQKHSKWQHNSQWRRALASTFRQQQYP